ncbi:beta-galactosidase trimerization domain-containing protein [Thermodesulfobacteriota bacterium]
MHPCLGGIQKRGNLQSVPAVSMRPEWNRFKVLVWPQDTNVLRDFVLYKELGMGGFQIDGRQGEKRKKAEFSVRHKFPYYVGHAADKGLLYLTGKNVMNVVGKRGLATRPHSLADPRTLAKMKEHLTRNINATKDGYVLAYAFDDEISLGRLAIPCDVDKHPLSIKWFREWLKNKYVRTNRLNKVWNADFMGFKEVLPKSFEGVRQQVQKQPLSRWNLAPWMDFRQFMDFQFAAVLSEMTRYTNTLAPGIPAGFVGGLGPGPWGGYDYALLIRAVQWMEAYDVHGSNEILRSWWNTERRPRMQTFFSTENPKLDSWFLWYYMLHGNHAVVAWPEGWFHKDGYKIAPHIKALKQTFLEIQGKVSEPIVDPKTVFDPESIGIYYSHPSIQAGWAMDAVTHGSTWINRKDSIDNENQSKGVLRKVWCKTLEDLGFQYEFVNYLDVQEGTVALSKKFKVIILPKTVCLSDQEAKALERFVLEGGTLIADYLCGILDNHGKGRPKGALDELFGLKRDESSGYMNGKGLTEIDGEKYQQPFLKRFTFYDGAHRHNGIVVFEQGTKHRSKAKGTKIRGRFGLFHRASVLINNKTGKGSAHYLNLTPLEYWDPSKRFSDYGHEWREVINQILLSAGLKSRVTIYEHGNPVNMIESLFWRNGNKHYLGLVKNPTEQKGLDIIGGSHHIEGITGKEIEIHLEFKKIVKLINLREIKHLGIGHVFKDRFRPWEGNLYEVGYVK